MDSLNFEQYDELQLLTLILSENQSHRCSRLIKERGIRGGMILLGKGTVGSSILNLFGIKNQRKDIIQFLLKSKNASEILDCLDKELQLSKPGHGIAYTSRVLRAVGLQGQDTKHGQSVNSAQNLEGQSMFKKLTVVVDRGMSGEVMDIALKAGVRGGTILHGRGAGADIATKLFGMDIEPEKELVHILLPDALVDKVVDALTEQLKLSESGMGILFVEPVIETRGLIETIDR
jgi:nitrogen regulatory protein PII